MYDTPDRPNQRALNRLKHLTELAGRTKQPGRTHVTDMIRHFKEHPEVRTLLCEKTDRLQMRHALRQGVKEKKEFHDRAIEKLNAWYMKLYNRIN